MSSHKLAYFLLAGVAIIFTALLLLCDKDDAGVKPLLADQAEVEAIVIPDSIFGFPKDSFDIFQGSIARNEFLADILLGHDVDYVTIDRVARASKGVYDVRYLRHGKKYTILKSTDSLATAQYFIYQPNAIEYVVYPLQDTSQIYVGELPVHVRTREASGIITSSLFETLQEQKVSPALAMELANVYAWTIDFYRIQRNDYFKVIFEERYVDDEFVGIGEVHASLFNHSGGDFYAFQFDNTTGKDYFDDEGNSLRKAFLKSPLKYGRMTSGYTMKRFHPVQKRWKAHLGTDYAAPRGTPILAVGDGVVTEAKFSKYNGNYVKIRHNSTYTTQYLHMSKIGAGMKSGTSVRQGDVIGYVGSTGLATGPHVCFRFWKNGKQVNHRNEPMPPSKPVDPSQEEEFMKLMQKSKNQLDQIPIDFIQREEMKEARASL
jgi:murein DD-endopeptidase MepM/ murein hydrolase activator NlpD